MGRDRTRPGILAYGSYLPAFRLERSAITDALGAGGGRGTRTVAAYDEDPTSMAVEAARAALRVTEDLPVGAVALATTAPPYLDKTNATAVHAALGLPREVAAFDVGASVRSAAGALRASFTGEPTLLVAAEVRTGLPGGTDESEGGDGAAALLVGEGSAPIAELLATASASGEHLDRWRLPGAPAASLWEERFAEHASLPLAEAAVTEALKRADLSPSAIDHVVVAGLQARVVRRVTDLVGADATASRVGELASTVGNAGAAQLGLGLADVLDRAEPGQLVLAVSVADGADAFVLRTTAALPARRQAVPLASQVQGGRSLPYATFLTWRGMLRREPPRRPDPERPAAPPSLRRETWKYGFVATRCEPCGARHLPPARVCLECGAVDQMAPERLADVPGTIATFTIDRLAFSLHPPAVVAVVDFDGGGRYTCELTDVEPGEVRIGDRVEMTFRRLHTAAGVHNYFWKARPVRGGA